MGQIKVGAIADAVLLSANPLEDITATRSVEAVINRGVLLTRDQLNALVTMN